MSVFVQLQRHMCSWLQKNLFMSTESFGSLFSSLLCLEALVFVSKLHGYITLLQSESENLEDEKRNLVVVI